MFFQGYTLRLSASTFAVDPAAGRAESYVNVPPKARARALYYGPFLRRNSSRKSRTRRSYSRYRRYNSKPKAYAVSTRPRVSPFQRNSVHSRAMCIFIIRCRISNYLSYYDNRRCATENKIIKSLALFVIVSVTRNIAVSTEDRGEETAYRCE